jgi:hypothetical protein
MHNIIITKTVKAQLEEIHKFIAKDNSIYADKVCETIVWFIGGILCVFPHIGKPFSQQWILEVIEPWFKYKIVYIDTWTDIIIVNIYKYQDPTTIKNNIKIK